MQNTKEVGSGVDDLFIIRSLNTESALSLVSDGVGQSRMVRHVSGDVAGEMVILVGHVKDAYIDDRGYRHMDHVSISQIYGDSMEDTATEEGEGARERGGETDDSSAEGVSIYRRIVSVMWRRIARWEGRQERESGEVDLSIRRTVFLCYDEFWILTGIGQQATGGVVGGGVGEDWSCWGGVDGVSLEEEFSDSNLRHGRALSWVGEIGGVEKGRARRGVLYEREWTALVGEVLVTHGWWGRTTIGRVRDMSRVLLMDLWWGLGQLRNEMIGVGGGLTLVVCQSHSGDEILYIYLDSSTGHVDAVVVVC
ncbi:hypothetical protein Tco_0123056 [Tanacetum coccineum]